MRMCDAHWAELRAAIDVRGLTHMVANSPEELSERITNAIETEECPEDYDPLWAASFVLSMEAIRLLGLYLLEGDHCPLCEVDKAAGEGEATNWIEGCCDVVAQHCRQRGQAPRLQ